MSSKRTFRLNKIVRDEIPRDIVDGGGEVVRVHLRTKEQKREALAKKITEEAMEAGASGSASELADLQEAVDRLVANEGLTPEDIKHAQEDKRARLGGFENCYFIEEVRLPADNAWVEYYAGNPDRFPEV